jgi:RNA polymerase sigma-70 factor (ECF subfamily)
VLELTDAELARRCRQGEPDAWRLLVRRVSPLVYRIAVRVLGRGAEAEDAGQEALLNMHRGFSTFDPTRPLNPWVARIAYNTSIRHLKRRNAPGQAGYAEADFTALPDDRGPSPERVTAHRQSSALVAQALARLDPRDRVLVTLTYQEGLSNAEVAEAMEMPIGTVKTRLHRARGTLRRWLRPRLRGDHE